jgi:hypothetical protein
MHVVKIPTGKTLSREKKRASFELWKAKVPLKEIRSHIQMAEVACGGFWRLPGTIQMIPAQIKRLVVERVEPLKSLMEFMPRRLQEVIDREGWKLIIICT